MQSQEPQVATVYIVDDDDSVRRSLSRLMRSAGFEPCCSGSAEQFLRRREWARPACLLLDISMPGMNGLAVQDELARQGQAMPIVFISGHGSVAIATRAMKSGAVDFLEKPYRPHELLKRVGEALERDRRQCAARAARAQVLARYASLTHRERQVMGYVVRGYHSGTARRP
jgi:FixJ family two-component response regulator